MSYHKKNLPPPPKGATFWELFDYIWDNGVGQETSENGEPVACGWAFAYPNIEFTAFFGGTAIEAHRHKGWFASILAARVQHARSLGRRYATVGAEPEIQSMLEKFGFERISSAYYLYWQGDQGSSS